MHANIILTLIIIIFTLLNNEATFPLESTSGCVIAMAAPSIRPRYENTIRQVRILHSGATYHFFDLKEYKY